MGLEDVVVDEFRERAETAGVEVANADEDPFGLQSYALVKAEAPPEAALKVARRMRSVHHVLAPLYTFSLPGDGEAALRTIRTTVESLEVEAMETAGTFRATTVRQGDHDFTSVDVQRVAGGGLDAHYDAAVDLEDYDVEVRVDVHDDRCLVSVQHTREALSRRQLEGYQPRAALKANVAYALLRLVHLDAPPEVLLDPFCGSGTILLEAADLWPEGQGYGNDWDAEAVAGARENVERAGLADRITIREGDVWHLAETFEDVTADLVVTNPPFGVRMASSMDFLPFYRRVLGQLSDVLRSGGTVVMLVLREGPFNTAIRETEAFTIRHVRVIEIGGLYPHVFVLERR
jgi:tRNA (guanine6-N2)-methyltransferase